MPADHLVPARDGGNSLIPLPGRLYTGKNPLWSLWHRPSLLEHGFMDPLELCRDASGKLGLLYILEARSHLTVRSAAARSSFLEPSKRQTMRQVPWAMSLGPTCPRSVAQGHTNRMRSHKVAPRASEAHPSSPTSARGAECQNGSRHCGVAAKKGSGQLNFQPGV